jgi:uncharacterized membrane protein
MRFDEALNFMAFASKNLPTIIADYAQPNNHIFNTLLMHLTYQGFGNHPIILRMSSWIPGILIIPLIYIAARQLFNREIALLASGLAAVSPPLIDLSVNARGYSLQTFFTILLVWLGWRLKLYNRTRDWLVFAVVSALGFLTIPTMLYPMGGVALWLLLTIWFDTQRKDRDSVLQNYVVALLLGGVLTVVLYAPVLIFSGLDRLIANASVLPYSPQDYLATFGDVWISFGNYLGWGTPFPVILLVMAFIGILVHRHLSKSTWSPFLAALIWLVPVLLIQRVWPYPRTITPLIPLYLIACAVGIFFVFRLVTRSKIDTTWFTGGLTLFLATCTVISGVIFASRDTGWAEDAQIAALYFASNLNANDTIFYSYPTNWTVKYYEQFHHLSNTARPTGGKPRQYIYFHWDDERARLVNLLKVEVHSNYANATFNVVRKFAHSTLEEIILPQSGAVQ